MLENFNTSIPIIKLPPKEAKELQQLLTASGYSLQADGIIGKRTIEAFRKFKKDEGLTHPDLLGETTLQHLFRRSRNFHSSSRHINPEGLKLIKHFEGCKLKAYRCPANIATIGYGSTFYPNGTPVRIGDTITQDEADELLLETLKSFEHGVARSITVPLSSNQFSALVSFAFNVGLGAFRSSTMLKLINRGEIDKASLEFIKWTKAGGKVLEGLRRRRVAEQTLFTKKD